MSRAPHTDNGGGAALIRRQSDSGRAEIVNDLRLQLDAAERAGWHEMAASIRDQIAAEERVP